MKSYSEMIKYDDYKDRFKYLLIGDGIVGDATFGGKRYLNQTLYRSPEWKRIRRQIIIRDNGYDLSHKDYMISGKILIHHINPITPEDIFDQNPKIMDPENLISVAFPTHNAIHFGDLTYIENTEWKPRSENDTCPWRL